MNQKTKQRWFALSSLIITFLLVKVFQNDLALVMKSDRPLEAGVQSLRYSLAKWNYYLSDLWLQREMTVLTGSDSGKTVVSGSNSGYLNHQEKLVIPLILDSPHVEAKWNYIVARFNGKHGMVDLTGEVIIPFIYDRLEFNRYTQDIKAKKNDRWGIINEQGKVVVPLDYDELGFLFDNHNERMYLSAIKGNQQEVIDLENNLVAPFEVDRVIAHMPNITIVDKNGVIGFVNGNKFTPPIVDEKGNYLAEDVAIVSYYARDGNYAFYRGSYCVVDRQGKILAAASTENQAANRRIDNLCRRLNKAKKLPILNKYSTQEQELGKLTPILINNKYGYINSELELVIAPQFDEIEELPGGFNIVENREQSLTGVITSAGKYIPLPTKDNGEFQINEVTLVGHIDKYSNHYCIIDRTGNLLLSAGGVNLNKSVKAQKIDNLCRNLVGIKVNNELIREPKPQFADNKEVPDYEYYFQGDLLPVIVNGKRGYVNRQGELAFPQLFDHIGSFSEGLAAVQIGDRFGFINSSGEMVLPSKDYLPFSQYASKKNCQKYDYFGTLSTFKDGLAIVSRIESSTPLEPTCEVKDNVKYYYLNKDNQIVAGDLIDSTFIEAKEVLTDIIETTIKVKNHHGEGYHHFYGRMRTDGEILYQHQANLPDINYP